MCSLLNSWRDKLNFEEFDPKIGVDGYCNAIREVLFPNSTPESVDKAILNLEYRIYTKGSIFSRVRPIQKSDFNKFLVGAVHRKEFFPPTRSVAQVPIGRFNNRGERKLYLADHPYVALRECGIEPGDYFLFSYFSFKADTFFIDANSDGSRFYKLLNSLFQSNDNRFYEVINRVYENYLDYEGFQGIAYNSVKVKKGYQDDSWGEVDSATNLAMKEDDMPSADLMAGWFAQCDESYRPRYLRMFRPLNPKKKSKLTPSSYHDNKSQFILENSQIMGEIQHLKKKSKLRIQRKEYADPKLSPTKLIFKD
jgi:hypothetical protein